MRTETTEETGKEQALAALAWASRVSRQGVDAAGPGPLKPTAAALRAVSVGELREHLDALLLGKHVEPGLDALEEMGVLDAWLPEVAAMVGFGDGEWRHKDVWKHTKQVVRQSVPRLAVRWGALLHDIGKPKTRKILPDGEVHFHGHAEVGAAMFRKRVASRLGFEGDLYERVHYLVLYHLRASQYDGDWTDSAVRRFAREMGEGLDDLLALSRADITTKRPQRKKRGLAQISALAARIRELAEEDARVPPLPKGLGTEIMSAFGVPPSKRLGDLMKRLEAACEAGAIEGGREAAYYIDYLRAHASEHGLDA
jgi:poly(A) polymerase